MRILTFFLLIHFYYSLPNLSDLEGRLARQGPSPLLMQYIAFAAYNENKPKRALEAINYLEAKGEINKELLLIKARSYQALGLFCQAYNTCQNLDCEGLLLEIKKKSPNTLELCEFAFNWQSKKEVDYSVFDKVLGQTPFNNPLACQLIPEILKDKKVTLNGLWLNFLCQENLVDLAKLPKSDLLYRFIESLKEKDLNYLNLREAIILNNRQDRFLLLFYEALLTSIESYIKKTQEVVTVGYPDSIQESIPSSK